MRDYSTCSPVSMLFFGGNSRGAELFSSSWLSCVYAAVRVCHAVEWHVMLARTLRFWHDAGNLQTALRWKNFRRHKWLVFAGIVADHWRMDRHSVMVAAR